MLEQIVRDRFYAKVAFTQAGCWEWMGRARNDGYTKFRIGLKNLYAHRVAYEDMVGPIPKGMTVDHLCRNRRCVRYNHLEVVTRGENVLRGEGHAAKNASKTHCIHGHEFTPDNTRLRRKGRECKTCSDKQAREWQKNNPEKARTASRKYYNKLKGRAR